MRIRHPYMPFHPIQPSPNVPTIPPKSKIHKSIFEKKYPDPGPARPNAPEFQTKGVAKDRKNNRTELAPFARSLNAASVSNSNTQTNMKDLKDKGNP
jgi:hypothetical protein